MTRSPATSHLACCVLALGLISAAPALAGGHRSVVVNGVMLSPGVLASLEQAYGVRVPDGSYWYDRVSGMWGREGGPVAGQMRPGHRLGGPLRPDASHSQTGVFVNGREIHPIEVAYLQRQFGQVLPGRYWLDARGIGGYEGGPAQFQIGLPAGGGGGGRSESLVSGYFLTGVAVIGN